jgi:hypothetical protein
MPWRISYQHPLRPDDGGIRFVPDRSEAAAEKLRLELRGYAVSTPTQAAAVVEAHARLRLLRRPKSKPDRTGSG